MRLSISLLIFLILPLTGSTALVQSETTPSEVLEYIEANNYVATFSTPQERLALGSGDTSSDALSHADPDRLQSVFRKMQIAEERVRPTTPYMPIIPFGAYITWQPIGLLSLRSVERIEDDRLMVYLEVHVFDLSTQQQLIAGYEEGELNEPPPELTTGRPAQLKKQIWTRANEQWQKSEASLFSLDD